MTQAPAVAVRGLSGGYVAGDGALQEVNFEVWPGQVVAVLAPNGGGKTTLFRALLGELPIARGEIELPGRPAYVAQTERSRLDFPVSALDVALMGAYGRTPFYKRLSAAERTAGREALERVGLSDRARATFGTLSGGQRQRVFIARAIVQQAPVILLDEPLSGVDRVSASHIERIFDELRSEGRALLVATHDIEQARRLDRVLCLARRQVAFGPPDSALSTDVLRRTYGAELIVLDDRTAVAVDHHSH
jgi:manganese/iron transport system ATP-binding protein/manganese/zinc/iron transport system ATP- binding protein